MMKKIIITLLLAISFNMSAQTTYTVTSTAITGTGSFTEAIGLANANPGADIIEFTPGLQVDASVPSVGPSTSIMAHITESVVIDGKGGALNGIQTWVNLSGTLNPLASCPGDVSGTIQFSYMPGFVKIGSSVADNTGIDVSIKNLTIQKFNQVAEIYKNASLVLENFEAYDTWSTYQCAENVMINAAEGVSLTITDSKFSGAQNWSLADAAASIYGFEAGDLNIENSQFADLCQRDQPAIYWDGASGSKVNIVSSNIVRSGGIRVLGESVSNIVNSIWVNYYFQVPEIGDRIINSSSGDMNIIASSLIWNTNECNGLCQQYLYENLFEIKGAGNINFSESAVGFNWDPETGAVELNTLGVNGGSGAFTADVYTWIQPTLQQDAAALKTMTSQPALLTDLFGFNREVFGVTGNWDVEMATPAFPGELIDVIPSGTPLINPIDGLPITLDVVGNPREDANGKRDIGALQLALAPFLGVSSSGDAFVDLNWNEPLHHDGLTIIKYEVVYDVTGGSSPTTVTIDPPVLSKTISGLTNGTEYEFQVRAVYTGPVNGPYSNTVKETPLGPIGTPVVDAVPGDGWVYVNWSLPDLGGRDFSIYIIQWRIEGTTDFMGAQVIPDESASSFTVPGLVNGTTYEFAVKVYASGEFSNPGFAIATPTPCPGTIKTWNGTIWLPAGAPGLGESVVIDGDFQAGVLNDGNLDACSLVINAGATLSIPAAGYINVNGNITVDGSLLVEHEGSVVQIDDAASVSKTGIITVAKTTPFMNEKSFMVIGSPMDDEMREGVYTNSYIVRDHHPLNFVPNPDVTAMFPFALNFADDNGNNWLTKTGLLNPGEGYMVFPQPDTNASGVYTQNYTQGVLNNGMVTQNLIFNGTQNASPNILANPYASAINIDLLFADPANADIDFLYFWDHITPLSATYPGYNPLNFNMGDISRYSQLLGGTPASNGLSAPSRVLSSGQGFGVRAANATITATFNNAMRITGPNDTYRTTEPIERNRLWVRVHNETYDQGSIALIGFTDVSTDGYNKREDDSRIATPVSIYSEVGTGEELGINAMGPFEISDAITVGFSTMIKELVDYKISIHDMDGPDFENVTVYLIDGDNGSVTNLSQGDYVFQSGEATHSSRFKIVFEYFLGSNDVDLESIALYPNPTQSAVTIISPQTILTSATIFDIRGRKIFEVDFRNQTNYQIDLSSMETAVYFIEIATDDGTVMKRVMKN